MVLVHVDIAGKDNIKNMDNDDAWTSLATSMIHVNDTLSSEILFDAAGKLEISFTDENMMNRLRQFAGQSVPHFHVHLIPRYGEGDALQLEFHESAPQDLNALCALLSE